jgi:hypothetical protein
MTNCKRSAGVTERFLFRAGFIFLVLYFGILALQWVSLRQQALADAQENARAVAERFVIQFTATVELSRTLDHLHDPERFRALDDLIREQLSKFGLQKCKIYDRHGKILYADEPTLIGKMSSAKKELQEALSGNTVSKVISREEYESSYGLPTDSSTVETYLPMVESEIAPIRYVLEAYQNLDNTKFPVFRTMLFSGMPLALILSFALSALAYYYRESHQLRQHIETLGNLLPICSHCKDIRVKEAGEPDRWVPVEAYFEERDRVEFTHGLCGACIEEHYPEYGRKKQ